MAQLSLFQSSPPDLEFRPQPLELCLETLFNRLNREYFANAVRAQIRWGRYGHRPRRVRRRTLRLGAYFFETRVIRIHPVLAQPWVPRPVLESVIHHEMCHAAAPTQKNGCRRRHHHHEFRHLEQKFEHHDWVEAWLKKNLDLLLKARRK